MSQKPQKALQKMQEIANKLISNTPELAKVLEPDSALRPKRTNSPASSAKKKQTSPAMQGFGKADMTSNDYFQKCKELNNELITTKGKVQTLEDQLSVVKQRFVEREIQYRKIIEELQDELKSKSSLDSNDRHRMQQINELHKEILDNIGTIQNKTSKILIEQESDIRRFFHKKINEIKDKFREDKINKNEKDNEYQQKEKQMMTELEWIKNIAQKIDIENQALLKKHSALKSEFEMQEKDKDLLMRELLVLKKENAVLKTQVQKYQALLKEVSQEIDTEQLETQRQMRLQDHESQIQKQSRIPTDNSRVSKQAPQANTSQTANPHLQNTVQHLNNVISKERKRVRDLKNLYMREMAGKSELDSIVRSLIDDVRFQVVEVERSKNKNGLTPEARQKLLEKILHDEKILTLVYDKMFYGAQKTGKIQAMPPELSAVMEGQGFDVEQD